MSTTGKRQENMSSSSRPRVNNKAQTLKSETTRKREVSMIHLQLAQVLVPSSSSTATSSTSAPVDPYQVVNDIVQGPLSDYLTCVDTITRELDVPGFDRMVCLQLNPFVGKQASLNLRRK